MHIWEGGNVFGMEAVDHRCGLGEGVGRSADVLHRGPGPLCERDMPEVICDRVTGLWLVSASPYGLPFVTGVVNAADDVVVLAHLRYSLYVLESFGGTFDHIFLELLFPC